MGEDLRKSHFPKLMPSHLPAIEFAFFVCLLWEALFFCVAASSTQIERFVGTLIRAFVFLESSPVKTPTHDIDCRNVAAKIFMPHLSSLAKVLEIQFLSV